MCEPVVDGVQVPPEVNTCGAASTTPAPASCPKAAASCAAEPLASPVILEAPMAIGPDIVPPANGSLFVTFAKPPTTVLTLAVPTNVAAWLPAPGPAVTSPVNWSVAE